MPDNGQILVGLPLGEAGNNVRNRAAAISTELDALKKRLEPIFALGAPTSTAATGTAWSGDGQQSYAPYQMAWNNAATGLFGDGDPTHPGVLGQIAHLLDVCWINYCNNEQAIVKGWTPTGG